MTGDSLKTLLIRSDVVSRAAIAEASRATRGSGTTWLEWLLLLGALEEDRLCALVSQVSRLPRCDAPRLAVLPERVVALVPAEVAAEHRVVPLAVEGDGYLRIATLDPTNDEGLDEVAFFTGRSLMREVSLATPLAWALYHYYGARTALWPRANGSALRHEPALL